MRLIGEVGGASSGAYSLDLLLQLVVLLGRLLGLAAGLFCVELREERISDGASRWRLSLDRERRRGCLPVLGTRCSYLGRVVSATSWIGSLCRRVEEETVDFRKKQPTRF